MMIINFVIFYSVITIFAAIILNLGERLKAIAETHTGLNFLIILTFIFLCCLIVGSVIINGTIIQKFELAFKNDWIELVILLAPIFWLMLFVKLWRSLKI